MNKIKENGEYMYIYAYIFIYMYIIKITYLYTFYSSHTDVFTAFIYIKPTQFLLHFFLYCKILKYGLQWEVLVPLGILY